MTAINHQASEAVNEHDWTPTNARIPGHRCQSCHVLAPGDNSQTAKPCPGKRSIFVRFGGDHYLTVGEVWPDGDYPDEVTAEAVIEAMRGQDLQMDWNLHFGTFVSVDGGPEVRRR